MSKNNTINILICLDDLDWNYTRHCAVTMLSVLETNKNNKIKFYIISSCLPEDNINELNRIVNEHNQEIEFIIHDNIIPEYIKSLLINSVNLTRWTRYRLFFNLYIKDIDRILYLDCDTIIVKDLSWFYNMDMEWKAIVGVCDPFIYEKRILDTNHYINAWVLLIDANKYGKQPVTEGKIKSINNRYWKYLSNADQDYLNILFKDDILVCEIWFNYFVVRPFLCLWLENASILHCLAKPYLKYSLCPKHVIKLYYSYLNKTKWKWFPKSTDKSLWKYIFDIIGLFLALCIEKIFWPKWVLRYHSLRITERIHNLLRTKNC
jgi:lipopolysaccharide biosynthesis glycosyltransferase